MEIALYRYFAKVKEGAPQAPAQEGLPASPLRAVPAVRSGFPGLLLPGTALRRFPGFLFCLLLLPLLG